MKIFLRFVALLLMATPCAAEGMENRISIPLSSIVTTSPQRGMLHTKDMFPLKNPDRDSAAVNEYLRQVFGGTLRGASNAFLVDAVDTRSAIDASFGVFVGGRSVDTVVPVNKPDPPRGNHWLVVYLGSGPSGPISWKVEEVTVNGSAVTLSYRKAPPSPVTSDSHPYYYWIPLSTLASGTYDIHLYDAGLRATTLMRRVEVLSSIGKGSTP